MSYTIPYKQSITDFFYAQKTFSGEGANSVGTTAIGGAYLGRVLSNRKGFRTAVPLKCADNLKSIPIVISDAQLNFSGRSKLNGDPTIKAYLYGKTTKSTALWDINVSNLKYLGSFKPKETSTLNLNNEELANYLTTNTDYSIILTGSESTGSSTLGALYSSANMTFNWDYGASEGTIENSTDSNRNNKIQLGDTIKVSINSLSSSFTHKISWYIGDD